MIPNLPFLANRKCSLSVEEQVRAIAECYLACASWIEGYVVPWSDQALELAEFEVKAFLHLARWNIQDWPLEELGRCFWLTRNGHGTGFWDSDIGTEEARANLTNLAQQFGERSCYVENGVLYFD